MRQMDGQWIAFMADRMPPALDDAIKGRHWEMAKALGKMSPQDLWEFVPMVFPMTNHHPVFPMLSRFPVEKWKRAGAPSWSTKGWCKFCSRLYQNNRSGLKHVFDVATQELSKEGDDYFTVLSSISHCQPEVWPGGGACATGVRTDAPVGATHLMDVDYDSDGMIEV